MSNNIPTLPPDWKGPIDIGRYVSGLGPTGVPLYLRRPDPTAYLYYNINDFNGGMKDDGAGTITGSANAYISKPPDIWEHFVRFAIGAGQPASDYASSGFGSFTQAVTDLDALTDNVTAGAKWSHFVSILAPITPWKLAEDLCTQAPMTFWRSMLDSQFKCAVYSEAPAAANYFLDPYGNNYKWSYFEDMLKDSISVGFTPLDECVSEVRVEFDYYAPTGQYKKIAFVGPGNSDNGNGTRDQNSVAPENREAHAASVRDDCGRSNPLIVQCPHIVQYEQALKLRNYLFDRFFRPRLLLQFDTWSRASTVEPNMATLVSNDLTDYLPCPKYPIYSAPVNWDDMIFFVNSLSMRHTNQGDVWTMLLEEIPVDISN